MSHLSPGDKFDPEYVQQLTQLEIQSIVTHLTMIEINGLIKKLADGKYEVLLVDILILSICMVAFLSLLHFDGS